MRIIYIKVLFILSKVLLILCTVECKKKSNYKTRQHLEKCYFIYILDQIFYVMMLNGYLQIYLL